MGVTALPATEAVMGLLGHPGSQPRCHGRIIPRFHHGVMPAGITTHEAEYKLFENTQVSLGQVVPKNFRFQQRVLLCTFATLVQ